MACGGFLFPHLLWVLPRVSLVGDGRLLFLDLYQDTGALHNKNSRKNKQNTPRFAKSKEAPGKWIPLASNGREFVYWLKCEVY